MDGHNDNNADPFEPRPQAAPFMDWLQQHIQRDTNEELVENENADPANIQKVVDIKAIFTRVHYRDEHDPPLTYDIIADRVLREPVWEEARAIMANPPVTKRRINPTQRATTNTSKKVEHRRACPGKDDTCSYALKKGMVLCYSCVLQTFGFPFVRGGPGLSQEEFIIRCIIIHGGLYDYTNTVYRGDKQPIQYICPFHGENKQLASNHVHGSQCKGCNSRKPKTPAEWIAAFRKVHGDKYDYSRTIVVGAQNKITLRCIRHNLVFEQHPGSHLQGRGCDTCGRERTEAACVKDTPHFITKAHLAHTPGRYLYDLVEYHRSGEKVYIICGRCPNRFVFQCTPDNHYKGRGCPKCKQSHLEAFSSRVFDDLKIVSETQTTFEGCVGTCRLLRFDAVVCNKQLLIELDGLQHFQTSTNWNGDAGYQKRLKHDNIKDAWCLANNKILLRISHVDLKNMKELIEHALHWLENQPPDVHGGYILATKFYTTFKDRDTSKYIILD